MRLDDSRRSDNVEEDQGSSGGFGRRGAGIGLGTIVILVIGYFMGVDPSTLLSLLDGGAQQGAQTSQAPAPADSKDPDVDFVRAVLAQTEDVWGAYFKDMGRTYQRPTIHLYRGQVQSACGFATAAAGPFYCPGDRKVYLDLTFFHQLATQFGAPGDFARAYVIAHEVGHHVQNLLGITDKAAGMEQRAGRSGANHVSVEVELQADCFAGVWAEQANSTHKILEPGDLDEGLRAAASVGDDTLQRRSQGSVVPDSFTHGSSAQRVNWFKRGFQSGKLDACNTFGAGAAL